MNRTSDIALEPRPFPAWARNNGTQSDAIEAGFAAGAALAALDAVIRANPPWSGALRQRMALSATSATAGANGRNEDDSALRDAWLLCKPGDDPGPAGRILSAWRSLASRSNPLDPDMLRAASAFFGIKADQGLDAIIASTDPRSGGRPPVLAAAEIAARVFQHRADAEPFAFWLADAVLAKSLGWPAAMALLACQIQHPSLKRGGRRVKPGEAEWISICCLAYARAAAQACDLASTLARRSEKLLAAAPKLRAKDSASVVSALLADDAMTATSLRTNMSDRALRRLFDRLVELDAIRELSGRPTFRIYGL